ncbi:DUF6088 family protein [Pseudomonas sp.]|uniref:DUF6088 family protein n=1 Tax=Pseudomonas sp. TaxID=306 RepID=UPI003D0AFBB3
MKTLPEKILGIIQELPEGEVLIPGRFLHLGARTAVQRGFSRLVEDGKLFRVARGLYVAAVETRFGVRPSAPEMVVQSLAKMRGELIVVTGARAANNLGLTTQVPVRYVFLTTGRSRNIQIGNIVVSIRHAPRWLMALGATGAGDAVRALAWIGEPSAMRAVARLHTVLPKSEWQALESAQESMPSWMTDAIRAQSNRS